MGLYSKEVFDQYQPTQVSEYPLHGTFWQKVKWFFLTRTFMNLVFGFLILFISMIITGICLIVVYYRRPSPPLLPDLIHEVVPYIPAVNVINWMISLGAITMFLYLIWPTKVNSFIILRRAFVIYSLTMMFRNITMTVTNLPDPSPTCPKDSNFTIDLSPKNILKFLFGGFTCGDLIFSGHTIGLLLPTLIIQHYFSGIIILVMWINTIVGSVLVVFSRLHYGVDVIITFFVLPCIWFIYHSISEHPDSFEDELLSPIKWYFAEMEWCDPYLPDELTRTTRTDNHTAV